jgi:predicted unusual protein kinase regulating ubiquinone biosynthesis (AarF/ABC1/UbiB family)
VTDDGKKVPEGRLARAMKLGFGGAKTGARLLFGGHKGAAAQAADMLGNLRGLAAKVGQIASYVDGIIPEEHRAVFDVALGALRNAAPVSPPAAIRALVIAELGRPPEEIFARFDITPFASASIGQVHRATTHAGEDVAVKIQHPDIELAVRADLDNAKLMESMIGFSTRRIGSKEALAEIRERFLEELDYALEAKRQAQFAALFANEPKIRIPKVLTALSSKRVLTSEFVTGMTLDEAVTRSEAERVAHCETLWRFVFSGNLIGGMFNADPHPGNYLFGTAGVVTFLDFGCVQPLPADHVAKARQLHRDAIARDESAFVTSVRALLHTVPGVYEDWAIAYSRACFAPMFAAPFTIDRAYSTSLVTRMVELRRILPRKDTGYVPLRPGMLFMNRLQFGFYSVLARFAVAVDYAAVEAQILAQLPA